MQALSMHGEWKNLGVEHCEENSDTEKLVRIAGVDGTNIFMKILADRREKTGIKH